MRDQTPKASRRLVVITYATCRKCGLKAYTAKSDDFDVICLDCIEKEKARDAKGNEALNESKPGS